MAIGRDRSRLPTVRPSGSIWPSWPESGILHARDSRVLRPERLLAIRRRYHGAPVCLSHQYVGEDGLTDGTASLEYRRCRRLGWADLSLRPGGPKQYGCGCDW